MLSKLRINNVALISNLELDFCAKLNILSGETGAGKSIIVDSLMLLLGERFDKTLIRYGCQSGYVEGVFDANDNGLAVLRELGLDEEELLIVARKFYADGKNEIRINGRVVTAGMLRQIMSVMVDIYGQNEMLTLSKQSEHLKILDYYVRSEALPIKEKISDSFTQYKNILKQLKELGNIAERAQIIDLLKYQIEEINKAKVKEGEEDDLVDVRNRITSVEKITENLTEAIALLTDNEEGISVYDGVSSALHAFTTIMPFSKEYVELQERLSSVRIEVEDIAFAAKQALDNLNFDISDLDRVEKRLELVRGLKRKYGDFKKMNEFLANAESQLYTLENCDELFEQLSKQKKTLVKQLYELSEKLSEIRKKGACDFEKRMMEELGDLGMENSLFKIQFETFPELETCEKSLTSNGMDYAEFYLSPNLGQPLKPLIKIISGGEMSRFMLALKVVSSQVDDIPTMIFDEIDAGISGKIGQEVAKKLATISRHHQILCVTHLPQIASMADNHYFIVKSVTKGDTQTNVNLLSYEDAVDEISRLSGGKDISMQSLSNAAAMKEWSDQFKSSL